MEVACGHVTACQTSSRCVCSQWTLTGMCRPLSTIQITDALQGTDEGRALGLPNPGSSVFHVPQLPTMLSRISRRSLSTNLKPARYTKGIRPGGNRMSNLLLLTDTSWSLLTLSVFAILLHISFSILVLDHSQSFFLFYTNLCIIILIFLSRSLLYLFFH